MVRLDKYLSDLGLASRKELREMIRSGRVTVDGKSALRPEQRLEENGCLVCLDGRPLAPRRHHYYMMDKPLGCVTATADAREQTVMELLPPALERLGLFPVGRLDKDSSGLLLLTDDGDFAHRVISPGSCVEKLYHAKVEGELDDEDVRAFAEGVSLRDGTRCLPARLRLLADGSCLVSLREGKYHQVRRMLASRGAHVTALRRLAIGALRLDEDLGPGGVRELTEEDLCKVFCTEAMEF